MIDSIALFTLYHLLLNEGNLSSCQTTYLHKSLNSVINENVSYFKFIFYLHSKGVVSFVDKTTYLTTTSIGY